MSRFFSNIVPTIIALGLRPMIIATYETLFLSIYHIPTVASQYPPSTDVVVEHTLPASATGKLWFISQALSGKKACIIGVSIKSFLFGTCRNITTIDGAGR